MNATIPRHVTKMLNVQTLLEVITVHVIRAIQEMEKLVKVNAFPNNTFINTCMILSIGVPMADHPHCTVFAIRLHDFLMHQM